MTYHEAHFHGSHGGIEVLPKAQVTVDEEGRFITSFSLVNGRVGRLVLDYEVAVGAGGVAELATKAYGSGDDQVQVNETIRLDGAGARGLTKTRIAVRDEATSEVLTTAEGNAPFTRGHMDCTEIVRDHAVARTLSPCQKMPGTEGHLQSHRRLPHGRSFLRGGRTRAVGRQGRIRL
jgi:uncharacterized protein